MRGIIIGLVAGVVVGVLYANAIAKNYLNGWVHSGDTYHYVYDKGVVLDVVVDACAEEQQLGVEE